MLLLFTPNTYYNITGKVNSPQPIDDYVSGNTTGCELFEYPISLYFVAWRQATI